MFVRAVLKQIPYRIGSSVSSTQSYPSSLADRGIIPMGTVWLISIFVSQVLAPVNAAALDIHAVHRGHLELGKERWPTLLKAPNGPKKDTVILLQKSYNGRNHDNKVGLSLGEFAVVCRTETALYPDDFYFNVWDVFFCLIAILQNGYRGRQLNKHGSSLMKMLNKQCCLKAQAKTLCPHINGSAERPWSSDTP